jgi:hypothetical protein
MPTREKIIYYTGEVTTGLAVVPFSLFGALLIDHYLAKSYIAIRVLADLIVFITSQEANRRLMRFFNKEDFNYYCNPSELLRMVKDIHSMGVLNFIFTVNISLLFSTLAIKSFDEAAHLMDSSRGDFGAVTSEVLGSPYFQAPFVFSNFLINLIAYPGIHNVTILYILKFFRERTSNADVFNNRLRYERNILIYREKLVEQNTTQSENTPQNLDHAFITTHQGLHFNFENIATLSDSMLMIKCTQDSENDALENYSLYRDYYLHKCIMMFFLFLCTTGSINFLDMGIISAQILRWPKIIGSVMGVLAFSSIMMLSITASSQLTDLLVFDIRNQSLIPNLNRERVLLLSFLICLCSGICNSYQAYLANESTFLIIMAAWSACIIELSGFYKLTIAKKEERLLKECPGKEQPRALYHRLTNLHHTAFFKEPYEEVHSGITRRLQIN